MLNCVRAFDQLAEREKKNRGDLIVRGTIDLPMIELIKQWKEYLDATDGMQCGIDRMGSHSPHLTQHLGVGIVHEMRDIGLGTCL